MVLLIPNYVLKKDFKMAAATTVFSSVLSLKIDEKDLSVL